jgi:hypothetical protein
MKRGRPSVGPRIKLGLRVTPEMKARLDAATIESGRSQSQEAEFRLAKSFWLDDLIAAELVGGKLRKAALAPAFKGTSNG